jgi:protein SCO1/2
MRCAVVMLVMLFAATGCGDEKSAKPLSEPGEKTYPFSGKVIAPDAGDNTLRVDHEAIPGFMEAMTMDFSVRGAEVGTLPADGSRVQATLHVTDRGFWLVDVRQIP